MGEWQQIETAPKDGTVLLLNGDHESYPMKGYFDPCEEEWLALDRRWVLGPAIEIPDPTSWQPAAQRDMQEAER